MVAAFLALGFLVGNLTAMSGSPIVTALVPAIFALMGGSVLAFLSKLSSADRPLASRAILSFSLACLVGTYVGIIVTSRHLLGPAPAVLQSVSPAAKKAEKSETGGYYYLRAADASEIDSIDERVRNGTMTTQDAYDRLRKALVVGAQ